MSTLAAPSTTPALKASSESGPATATSAGEGSAQALATSADAAGPSSSSETRLNTASLGQISSPHELTDWVDGVLDQLETRFASMSSQVDVRMKEMSERIDALETSIEDLITGATAPVHAQHTGSGGTAD